MHISVIIPTLNEEANIKRLIKHLQKYKTPHVAELLVVDGGSEDGTIEAARHAGANVLASCKSRAVQMNAGARQAKGEILYFVHADTLPPATYAKDILRASRKGYTIGCFQTKFESNNLMLKINGYCSRFDRLMCRGGDQTLFVAKALFENLNGYDDYYVVMEDYNFIMRAREKTKFIIIPEKVCVSARKYDKNNYFRVNLANLIVFTMFRLGYPPRQLRNIYQKLIDYPIS